MEEPCFSCRQWVRRLLAGARQPARHWRRRGHKCCTVGITRRASSSTCTATSSRPSSCALRWALTALASCLALGLGLGPILSLSLRPSPSLSLSLIPSLSLSLSLSPNLSLSPSLRPSLSLSLRLGPSPSPSLSMENIFLHTHTYTHTPITRSLNWEVHCHDPGKLIHCQSQRKRDS